MLDSPHGTDGRDAAPAYHALTADEVLVRLSATPGGLHPDEAARRLARHGPNRVERETRRTPLARLLAQFADVLIYVLLFAAGTTALLGHWLDTAVILGVVVVNGAIGFIQEGRAERSLDAIRGLLADETNVVRADRRLTIRTAEVVPGDIVLLQAGDRVPADLRLLRCRSLAIDEATLTGESLPAEKAIEPAEPGAPLGERSSMAFAGTIVSRGQGAGVAAATGDSTELGRISRLLREVDTLQTPLTRQLARFGRSLSWAILALAGTTFSVGVVRGYNLADLVLAAVGIAVAAIPEGLPAIVTITLALGVERMARRNAIIRHLPAVETLGAVSVICSDKTGTFTRNEMTVERVITREGDFAVTGTGYRPTGEIRRDGARIDPQAFPTLVAMARGGFLCNDAVLAEKDGEWNVTGDPMEGALLVFAAKAGLDPVGEATASPRADEIPFDAAHRFMATLHNGGAGAAIEVKGAPEHVFALCEREFDGRQEQPLDRDFWEAEVARLGGAGMRVLALATAKPPAHRTALKFEEVGHGLMLVGLFGLLDPPREEAIAAVASCRAAGIRVKMITGDHAGTARTVAGMLGLSDRTMALTGGDLDKLTGAEFEDAVATTDVFARTSPEHKLKLVEALQADGSAVAMTGDGVNDAPALRRADVGVAMGRRGSDAAREAAEMVLVDDNFATIVAAIEEGRKVYDNLRKSILFILPTNGAEAFVLVIAIALGLTLPVTAVQILWVNMVTAVTLSLALAFEPAEADLMRRPPRSPREPILTRFVLWRVGLVIVVVVAGVTAMFVWQTDSGASVAAARTAAVNTLVAFEAVYLLSVRRLRAFAWKDIHTAAAGPAWIAIGIVAVLQLAFIYVPTMNTLFGTAPLDLPTLLTTVAVALPVFVIAEWEKAIVRRRKGNSQRPASAFPAGR